MFRPRSLALLLPALALSLGACKPDIPEGFDSLVPAEHRDELEKVLEESEDLKKPGRDLLILWYEKDAVKKSELYAAYKKQVEGQGYKLMIECEVDDPDSMSLAKAPNEAISVSFRDLASVWHTDVERVQVDSIGLPLDVECKFTEHAQSLCKSISGDTCFMK
ncbi:MAG: hypothetical protein AAF799_13110 [Myxococcota bacterium]